jgi:sugar phosphate isomerase/epimerase
MKKEEKVLSFRDYPNLKLGFSTQNFLKSVPVDVASLEEIIKYAAKEGYSFIELRDPDAGLSPDECEKISEVAGSHNIEVIYEINANLLAPDFLSIFNKGLENTSAFPDPGIIRAIVSNTEFAADENKKGWTAQELNRIVALADSCSRAARERNLTFIVENATEAFFGKDTLYFGFADFFSRTENTGLQFDTANPFQESSRAKADPSGVEKYLASVAGRWVTTHLKSGKDGIFQPVLADNPLDLGTVLSLMSANNVTYVAFELAGVPDKQECFDNHSKSIDYLAEKGLMVK